MRKFLFASLAAVVTSVAAAAISAPAYADLTFTIGADSNFSGSGSPTGPFGLITLTDGTGAGGNGILLGTVHVQETLDPNVFANTGAGDNLEFSLAGLSSPLSASMIKITSLVFSNSTTGETTSGYTLDVNPTAPHGSGLGGFQFGIACNTSGSSSACGNGASPPQMNTLNFDITNSADDLKSTDFIPGDAAGYYFMSDIGVIDTTTGQVIATGYSGAACTSNCLPPPNGQGSVPEPASVLLLGSALIGLGWHRRRRG